MIINDVIKLKANKAERQDREMSLVYWAERQSMNAFLFPYF